MNLSNIKTASCEALQIADLKPVWPADPGGATEPMNEWMNVEKE